MAAQLAMQFDAPSHARRRDPQTSRDAAARSTGLAHEHFRKILAAMAEGEGLTAEEIADRCGLSSVQVNRRVADLLDARKLELIGQTRANRAGRQMRVLRKTQERAA